MNSERKEIVSMSQNEKKHIVQVFSRHINSGQVKYLKAGHLDVLETQRQSVRFIDPVSGRVMIDCFTSAGCFNVGRGNPVIKKAMAEALETLDMGTSTLISVHKIALAERLASIAPADLNKVLFASGGGDAIDCAIKLARGATRRSHIISTVKAYHGHTGFALSANGKEHYRKYCEPLMPQFSFVPFNDMEAIRRAVTDDTAAIIIEPVQGEAGIFVAKEEYLRGLRHLCDERNIILIFDEVQTGFGRTGKFFACEHFGVTPDILAMAKSIGGGIFPNGAVLYRDRDILTDFVCRNPQFHPTYTGGSDLGCFISLKVIDYIMDNNLPVRAAVNGRKLKDALEKLRLENPKIIREVRGIGMMVGIEYIHEFLGPMMSDALAKNGIFAAYSGNAPQVMRFMLPIALPAAKIPGVLKLLNSERVQTVVFNWIRSVEDFFSRFNRKQRSSI